jgi:hypothetical protein
MLGATVSCRPGRAHSGLPRRPTTCLPGTPHRAASVWVNVSIQQLFTQHTAQRTFAIGLYKSQHHVRAIVVSLRVVQFGNDVPSGRLSHAIRDPARDSSSSDTTRLSATGRLRAPNTTWHSAQFLRSW